MNEARAPHGQSWVHLGTLEQAPQVFRMPDDEILVVALGGKLVGISNICSHKMGPLAEGEMRDSSIQCPWHGFVFDVASGECLKGHARALRRYEIALRGKAIYAREVSDAHS